MSELHGQMHAEHVVSSMAWPRRLLYRIGASVIGALRACAQMLSLGVATLSYAARPQTWRLRTIRQEYVRQCYDMGVTALPSVSIAAALIGLALVFQTLYWLKLAGQIGFIGKFLVLALVREIAPVSIGLILIGRSATVAIVELVDMRRDGQVHMLRAQGIDPFQYLVIPRVIAFATSSFCLCIVFLLVALVTGYLAANIAGVIKISMLDFLNVVLSDMGPGEYLLIPLKTLGIGFVIGLSVCLTALASAQANVTALLPTGFMAAVLAVFTTSGLVTLVL